MTLQMRSDRIIQINSKLPRIFYHLLGSSGYYEFDRHIAKKNSLASHQAAIEIMIPNIEVKALKETRRDSE